MTPLRVAIHGAAGRVGQRLIALTKEDPQLVLACALERPDHPRLGHDVGAMAGVGEMGVRLASELAADVGVVIDFSAPAGTEAIVARCVARGLPVVVATTGLSETQQAKLREAATRIPLVWSPNMSMAVNLGMKLVQVAGQTLRAQAASVDVEILERHHRFKEDSPSGTALKFGRIVADAMGQTQHVHGRHGQVGKRSPTEIGYHAIRVGDNFGEHTIVFGLMGETLEVTVRASNRECYAAGALAAAKFVASKPVGLYSMFDVLGI